MGKSRGISGGGIEGNKVAQTRAPKVEPKPYAVSMGAVSRLGGMVGEGTPHKALYNKQGYTTPYGATPSVAGPGGGRMVMRAGSQSATPAPKPMSPSTRKF
jgi:hypothetical protein